MSDRRTHFGRIEGFFPMRPLAGLALLLACTREPIETETQQHQSVEVARPEPIEAEPVAAAEPEPTQPPNTAPVEVVARLPVSLRPTPEPDAPGIELVPCSYGSPPPDYARFVLVDAREGDPFVEVESSGLGCPERTDREPEVTLRGFIPREQLLEVLTRDAAVELPGRNVVLEIAAGTPVRCEQERCRVFAGGWSLAVDREQLPAIATAAQINRFGVCGKATRLDVPDAEPDADLSEDEIREIRRLDASLRVPKSGFGNRSGVSLPPPTEEELLGTEAWLERLEPGLFASLEIVPQWNGALTRRLDDDGPRERFAIGSPCAYVHSPGYDSCDPTPTSSTFLWGGYRPEPWQAYRPEGARHVHPAFVGDDPSQRVRWSAEAGATLRTRDGQAIGRLLSPHGWFRASRSLADRVCFEQRWLFYFQRRELCIDRDELTRRYTGPLSVTTTARQEPARFPSPEFDAATKIESAVSLPAAYDCARQALGRDREMAKRWAITVARDERGELRSRRVEPLDDGSDPGFSDCMRIDGDANAEVLRTELIVRLRKPEFQRPGAW